MHRIIAAAIILALAGCGHVPVTSLPKLSKLDIMTLDVKQLRVAVDMPNGLRVRENGAVIAVGLREAAGGPAREERVVLEDVTNTERGPISDPSPQARIFRIPQHDVARLEALRETIRQRKAAYPDDTKGYLTVTSAACRTAQLPDGPLRVNTWLKTSADEPYFILTRQVDIRSLVPRRDLALELPSCTDRGAG